MRSDLKSHFGPTLSLILAEPLRLYASALWQGDIDLAARWAQGKDWVFESDTPWNVVGNRRAISLGSEAYVVVSDPRCLSVYFFVPCKRPWASRKVTRPEESFAAVPCRRPCASRKVTRPEESVVAVPCKRPIESR